MDKASAFWIEYRFKLLDHKEKEDIVFTVYINKDTLIAYPPESSKESEWTKLTFNQCKDCPLDAVKYKNCPIAYNLSGLFGAFQNVYSIEKAKITVTVEERIYQKETTVQQGLRSIFGIYMAASGCPCMTVLKSMVRFHLPFASIEETVYRHVSNYLLSQYYEYIDGKKVDFAFEELKKKNQLVDAVNYGMCKRIENVGEGDVARNALTILNVGGLMVNMELESRVDSLKYLFQNKSL